MSGNLGAKAQQKLGLPDGFKSWTAFPFAGVNQSASRIAMDDKQFYWVENLLKIGDGALRALWDAGAALYTASLGLTMVSFAAFNIGAAQYFAVFLSDGTAVQVAYPSGAVTYISNVAGTFYNAANGQLPATLQSGSQYLLISNNNTQNDYWIWDGTILYSAGSIGPTTLTTITDGGSGYTSVPSYTVYGGTGSGVVLTPVISQGSVVALTVDSPGTGYLPGQTVQVAFSGGGSDTTPILEAVLASGVVQFLTLVAGGSGYPTGTFALGFSGGGSGATGTFTTSGGAVQSVSLTSGGSGYTSAPTVSFPIPGSGATITATEAGGSVTVLTITAGGSGYVPGTYPLAFSGGSGTGAAATYTVNASGVVASTTITAPGTGYLSNPAVAIPTGSGAAAVASLTGGAVTSVTVVNGGTNLTGTPTLTFVGGGGAGAQGTAVVASGAITSVTITNGGSGYTSAPAVEVQTGLNNAAAAVLTLVPFGVSGTTMESYQQRVWIAFPNQQGKQNNGGTFLVSAPDSLTDFATSDGGDVFTNTDRFLRVQYTFLRQTSNFLYATGDSSVSVISNPQTQGSPPSTTFSYQNTDPQVGSPWRDTAQDYANTILFGNPFGIYGIYGGSVRKVSKDLDNLFTGLVLPAAGGLVPTSAVANIYSQKVYLFLCTITDPFSLKPRNVMLLWNEKEWFIATQGVALTYIGTQEVASDIQAWGTDGKSLYPLFNAPSQTLVKSLSTKQYGGAQSMIINTLHSAYLDAEDVSVGQAGLGFDGRVDAVGIAIPFENSITMATVSCPSGSYAIGQTLTFLAPRGVGAMYGFGVGAGLPQVPGVALGLTLASSSPDFSLRNVSLGYIETTAVA